MVPSLIAPEWPAPIHVKAFSTQRQLGYSQPPYGCFNMGDHVGDEPDTVALNRQLLQRYLGEELTFHWLQQVHGIDVVDLDARHQILPADGATSRLVNQVCVVMTADCLPVLFTNKNGTQVAAAHAGWRGLCDGVLDATVARFADPADELLVWLGPAIGPAAFQVGEDVREAFCRSALAAETCFQPDPQQQGKWFGDLYALARLHLQQLGVSAIYGGGSCTFTDAEHYFSYRRDGQTGRMATGIWLSEQASRF